MLPGALAMTAGKAGSYKGKTLDIDAPNGKHIHIDNWYRDDLPTEDEIADWAGIKKAASEKQSIKPKLVIPAYQPSATTPGLLGLSTGAPKQPPPAATELQKRFGGPPTPEEIQRHNTEVALGQAIQSAKASHAGDMNYGGSDVEARNTAGMPQEGIGAPDQRLGGANVLKHSQQIFSGIQQLAGGAVQTASDLASHINGSPAKFSQLSKKQRIQAAEAMGTHLLNWVGVGDSPEGMAQNMAGAGALALAGHALAPIVSKFASSDVAAAVVDAFRSGNKDALAKSLSRVPLKNQEGLYDELLQRARGQFEDRTPGATFRPKPYEGLSGQAAPKSETIAPEPLASSETPKIAETGKQAAKTSVSKGGTSVKNEAVAIDREAMGLSELPEHEKETFAGWLDQAKANETDGKATAIADRVLNHGGVMTPEESAGVTLRLAELKNQHKKLLSEIGDGIKSGRDVTAGQQDLASIESEFDRLTQATKQGGTNAAKSLVSRKLTLEDDLSAIAIKQRATAAKGSALNPKQAKAFEDLAAQIESHQKTIADLEAELARVRRDGNVQTTASRVAKRKSADQLAAERQAIVEQIQSLKSKAGVTLGSDRRRAATRIPDPELIAAYGKLAFNYIETGVSKAEDIVNAVLTHFPEAHRSDIEAGLDQELSRQQALGTPYGERLRKAERRAKLRRVVANISQAQLDMGNLPPAVRKQATVLTKAIAEQKRQADLAQMRVRQRIEGLKPQDWGQRATKLQRFGLLSGVSTLGKLGAAATGRIVTSPIEEAAGGLISRLFSKIAAKSPSEAGFSAKAEVQAMKALFSQDTVKDVWQKLRTGANSLDAAHSAKAESQHWFADFFGRLHGAIKTPAQRHAFERSLAKRTEWYVKAGAPLTDAIKTDVGAGAYADSLRAILMNDNTAVHGYKAMIRTLESKGPGGKAGAFVLRTLMPIVKVPTNYVSEIGNYAGGGVNALVRYAATRGREMTAEEADAIIRALKKQGIGATLMAAGYYGIDSGLVKSGGYYDRTKKTGEGDLQPGDLEIAGIRIPHTLAHTPMLEAIHIGATLRNAKDSAEAEGSGLAGIGGRGAFKVGTGLLDQVPFAQGAQSIVHGMESENAAGKETAKLMESIVYPLILQQIAQYTDTDSQGKPVKRKARGFRDQIRSSVPIYRQQLPEK
jgi:hypothetical protein